MLMFPSIGLCYNDQYDLFCFIALFAANTYVKTSTNTVTHMYVIYVTSSNVHNKELAMRFYIINLNKHMYPNHALITIRRKHILYFVYQDMFKDVMMLTSENRVYNIVFLTKCLI